MTAVEKSKCVVPNQSNLCALPTYPLIVRAASPITFSQLKSHAREDAVERWCCMVMKQVKFHLWKNLWNNWASKYWKIKSVCNCVTESPMTIVWINIGFQASIGQECKELLNMYICSNFDALLIRSTFIHAVIDIQWRCCNTPGILSLLFCNYWMQALWQADMAALEALLWMWSLIKHKNGDNVLPLGPLAGTRGPLSLANWLIKIQNSRQLASKLVQLTPCSNSC